jgi:hypothetical protein
MEAKKDGELPAALVILTNRSDTGYSQNQK